MDLENTNFWISQCLVSIAIILDFTSFQCRQKKNINTCLFFAASLIGIHFLLLGHITAACLSLVSAVRFFTGIFTSSKLMMVGFLIVTVLIACITYTGLISVISALASVIITIAVFCKTDKHLRILMLAGGFFWLLHNIIIASPVAVLMETLFIVSNALGYYRYYGKR